MINRREGLKAMCVIGAAGLQTQYGVAAPSAATGMGLVVYDCNHRRKWMQKSEKQQDLFEPLTFLKHCHGLGAGGMQASLKIMQQPEIDALVRYAREHNLYIDAIISPPTDAADCSRFAAEVSTASAVGVQAARTVIMPGRRYERFKSLEEVRQFERRGQRMLELAAPIVEKHKVRLAVENHKDQLIEDRVALLQRLSSEFIGACVDTGNSFALLDDAYGAIEALAPFAFSAHLKDQALQLCDGGFELADIPLGQGSFDLQRMVAILRQAKPNLHISLELITRDPLRVPCLTSDYWRTMPTLPAERLARTLRFVQQNQSAGQQVQSLTAEAQVQLEDANVAASLQYAGEVLKI